MRVFAAIICALLGFWLAAFLLLLWRIFDP